MPNGEDLLIKVGTPLRYRGPCANPFCGVTLARDWRQVDGLLYCDNCGKMRVKRGLLREPSLSSRGPLRATTVPVPENCVCTNTACGFDASDDPTLWGLTPSGKWLCKMCWLYAKEHNWVNRLPISEVVFPDIFSVRENWLNEDGNVGMGGLEGDADEEKYMVMGDGVGGGIRIAEPGSTSAGADALEARISVLEQRLNSVDDNCSHLLAENARLREYLARYDPSFSAFM